MSPISHLRTFHRDVLLMPRGTARAGSGKAAGYFSGYAVPFLQSERGFGCVVHTESDK
jgi:hypothetical protein